MYNSWESILILWGSAGLRDTLCFPTAVFLAPHRSPAYPVPQATSAGLLTDWHLSPLSCYLSLSLSLRQLALLFELKPFKPFLLH